MQTKQKIIVIGGGFAGIQLVRQLDSNLFDVLLIDKINHHQFQPLFYQVATSQLEPSSISFPLRNVFKGKKNLQIRLAEVLNIDESNHTISTTIGHFDYDYLVIAIGCKTNFFGNQEIEKNAFTLKTTYEAITIRNHILQTFENIISAEDEVKESLLNLVIVGAGPTGVELAGSFAEIRKNILPKDYPGIDFSKFKIILVEGSKNTLNSMSENAKIASQKYLEEMGVIILTETIVDHYDGKLLTLKNAEAIKTKTVIWAAGVTGNKISGLSENYYANSNRLKVNQLNQVIGSQNLFAVGDIALMETEKYPKGHPQLANVAINQAKNLA
ncbi:FAD-dependent oxidoreductase, partial [Flavobacterium sp.]|uniref:NAD(P)/FAD-dependent oxidoreductase n=1 Tax=Flavobacterium sp. TaxID=239 RepID=UPI00286D9406